MMNCLLRISLKVKPWVNCEQAIIKENDKFDKILNILNLFEKDRILSLTMRFGTVNLWLHISNFIEIGPLFYEANGLTFLNLVYHNDVEGTFNQTCNK